MTHPNTYKLQADSGTLDIFIMGEIGLDFFGDGTNAANIIKLLSASKDVESINVQINSPGGMAFDGLAIYNALKAHPAAVTVDVIGNAASAASIVAMAGDTINMAQSAMMMIHMSHGGAGGTASEKRKAADMQDKLDGQLADIYVSRTGKPRDEVLALMEAETWFTADEAKAAGFADNITQAESVAACDVSGYGYKNAPSWLAHATAPPASPTTAPLAQQEKHDMKILAQAAGLPESATEAEIVAKLNADRRKHDDALAASAAKLSAITAVIGEEGDKAVGTVTAWKASHEVLAEKTAELDAIKAKAEADRHAALIKGGKEAGKLTADLEKHFADKPADEVEAFLAIAPKVVPVGDAKPAPASSGPAATAGELTHEGKAYADMNEHERGALSAESPEIFASLRQDWIDSGCRAPKTTAA